MGSYKTQSTGVSYSTANSVPVALYAPKYDDNHIGGCRKTCVIYGQCTCK